MTHLPYIAASYGLALVIGAGFALDAWRRVGRARRRLDAIDPRRRRDGPVSPRGTEHGA